MVGRLLRIGFTVIIIACLISGCKKDEKTKVVDSDGLTGQVEIMVPAGFFQDFINDEIIPKFIKLHPNVKVIVSNDDKTTLGTRLAAGDPLMFMPEHLVICLSNM